MSCIFCRIASGEIPSHRVLETENVVAFHDLSPQAPIHVLVIPRAHLESVGAAQPEHAAVLGELLLACRQVAEQLRVLESGFRVVLNTGPNGGQTVPHLHAHVLAGRHLTWPPG